MARRWRCWAIFLVLLSCACASAPRGALHHQPPPSASYVTDLQAGGVVGGNAATQVADLIEDLAKERGDDAEGDGALSAAATVLLRGAVAGQVPDSPRAQEAARRFGFVGNLWASGVVALNDAIEPTLRELLLKMPRNVRFNRYGVAADESARAVAFYFANLEVTLEPFPRALREGGRIRLRGELGERFKKAGVFVTSSSGAVREFRVPSRDIDVPLSFAEAGTHMLEILAEGEHGPEVLVNVPIQVGAPSATAQTEGAPSAAGPFTPEEAEQRVFELINVARRARGAPPVALDAELRSVALLHSKDMAEHNFHAHVSKATGNVQDRVGKSGILVARMAENIARAGTPEGVHQALMDSPAHRSAVLDPGFTHVGVGIVSQERLGEIELVTTQVFGRRPPPEAARQTAETVLDAIARIRAARGAPAVKVDAGLTQAAAAAVRHVSPDDPRTREQATRAAAAAIQAEVNRTRKNRPARCLALIEALELAQLEHSTFILNPTISRLGAGVKVIEHPVRPRLVILLLAEGSFATPVSCN